MVSSLPLTRCRTDLAYGTLYGGYEAMQCLISRQGYQVRRASMLRRSTSPEKRVVPLECYQFRTITCMNNFYSGNAVGGLKRDGFILSLNPYSKDPIGFSPDTPVD